MAHPVPWTRHCCFCTSKFRAAHAIHHAVGPRPGSNRGRSSVGQKSSPAVDLRPIKRAPLLLESSSAYVIWQLGVSQLRGIRTAAAATRDWQRLELEVTAV